MCNFVVTLSIYYDHVARVSCVTTENGSYNYYGRQFKCTKIYKFYVVCITHFTVPPDLDPVIGFEQQNLTVLESAGEIDVCVVLLNNVALETVLALVTVIDGDATGITKLH